MNDKRWKAIVTYIDNSVTEYDFEEFADLGQRIERGPNWNTIVEISILLGRRGPIGERAQKAAA
jgi:hypothetical protein